MTRCLARFVLTAAILLKLGTPAYAGVIDFSDTVIGGNTYRTFQDTLTGWVWLDLDNFWDASTTYNSLNTLLAGSGFHIANQSELTTLQASIPAIPANFDAEVVIVGGNYLGNPHPGTDRELMWGVFDDGNAADGVSWAWKFGNDVIWSQGANSIGAFSTLRSGNTTSQDLGAWVVSTTVTSVPEPTSLLLFGTGAAALAARARRRKAEEKEGIHKLALR